MQWIYYVPMVVIAFYCNLVCALGKTGDNEPWNLPLLPPHFPELSSEFKNTNGKQIPRHLWMAFKEIPDEKNLPDHLRRMFMKNSALNWTLHLANNNDKLAFMEKYYYNTSLLWAYKSIHPKLGNSAADIWRYCVLYIFGGKTMKCKPLSICNYFSSKCRSLYG